MYITPFLIMIHIVLFEPEQPGNVGNIIRACANMGADLHIIRPIPFQWNDAKLRRAGLDYHEFCDVRFYDDFDDFCAQHPHARVFALTTKTTTNVDSVEFADGDFLMFGPESRGLPEPIREGVYGRIRLPMKPESRSMNLANTVAICLFEANRRLGFPGMC